jgi:hypothetical protein
VTSGVIGALFEVVGDGAAVAEQLAPPVLEQCGVVVLVGVEAGPVVGTQPAGDVESEERRVAQCGDAAGQP